MSKFAVYHSFDKKFITLMDSLKKKYPEAIFLEQGIANDHIDIVKFSKTFFNSANNNNVADYTVDGNANVNEKNTIQYASENNKALMRLNALAILHKYIEQTFGLEQANLSIEKIVNGEIFVNDLHLTAHQPYCYAFDICNLLIDGMSFFNGGMKIGVPKRVDSFIALVIQATAYISNQISGAIAYPSFFIAMNYMYEKEFGEKYIESRNLKGFADRVHNQFQNLIYSLNFPFRSSQSSFTNLSIMDKGFINNLFRDYTYPDGTKPNVENIIELSKWFFEYYDEINMKEGMFTFPVITIAISLDKNNEYIDPDFVDWACKVNHSKSLANMFISEPNAFSSCCRLLSNLNDIGYQNSFGVGGISVGSLKVCGINLPRLNHSNNLDETILSIRAVLFAHRKIMEDRIDNGFMPLYSSGWISKSRQYSTVGFVGAYEYMVERYGEVNDEAKNDLLNVFQNVNSSFQLFGVHDNCHYNLEQIPAESMAVRLANVDNILGFNDKYELYSNQYISLMDTDYSIYDKFITQGLFDSQTSGGAILHINIFDYKPLSEKSFKNIVETARKSDTKYFGINYVFTKCKNGHYTMRGQNDKCHCGEKITDAYTRVVGFLTNVKHWNRVRRLIEFPKRAFHTTIDI